MVIILSPAKTLRKEIITHPKPSQPIFPDETGSIMRKLQRLTKAELKNLMGISNDLTDLNYNRFKEFDTQFRDQTGQSALYIFKGDVYLGLEAETLSAEEVEYAENHLFILSGLYGLLKPGTFVQPYRLEMGSRLKVGRKKNLYDFWGDQLTIHLEEAIQARGEKYLVNLASNEYSDALNFEKINATVLNIHFREWRKEKWTFVSYNAKKARGTMARYILQNEIETLEELKGFDRDGYGFQEDLSSDGELFFTK